MSGIGLYWCIVECLYENNGYLDLNQLDLLAYELRVDKNAIINLIDNYDLFKKNKKSFFSKSVLQRLEKINEISKKNKENIKKRWEKAKTNANYENDTTVLPLNYKEKEKKNKITENKIKENSFNTTTNIYEYIEKNFGRPISPVEYEKINTWLSLYAKEIIEHAVAISVMNSKKTFNYVEGILKTWKGKNLTTLNEILEDERQFDRLKYNRNNQEKELSEPLFDYDWLNDPDRESEEDK